MNNELLPCPFCGGKAETDASSVSEFYGHEHQDYTIECTKCGADMTVYTHSNKDGTPSRGYEFGCSCCNDIPAAAREKWNTRPQQSTPAGYVMVPVELLGRVVGSNPMDGWDARKELQTLIEGYDQLRADNEQLIEEVAGLKATDLFEKMGLLDRQNAEHETIRQHLDEAREMLDRTVTQVGRVLSCDLRAQIDAWLAANKP